GWKADHEWRAGWDADLYPRRPHVGAAHVPGISKVSLQRVRGERLRGFLWQLRHRCRNTHAYASRAGFEDARPPCRERFAAPLSVQSKGSTDYQVGPSG